MQGHTTGRGCELAYIPPITGGNERGTDTPLLHRRIIERAIELRARHHDSMEPMGSSGGHAGLNTSQLDEETVANTGHAPVMHVPRISQRNNALLHQISQILDRCTWTIAAPTNATTRHATIADRWQEHARARKCSTDGGCGPRPPGRVCVQALRVPFTRGRCSSHCGSGCCTWDCAGLLLLLLRWQRWRRD